MDDVKRTYREGEQDTKEAWRKADGDDSLADAVGNAGDELRKQARQRRRRPRRRRRRRHDVEAKEAWRKPPTATRAWPTRSATPATTCAARCERSPPSKRRSPCSASSRPGRTRAATDAGSGRPWRAVDRPAGPC